MTETGNWSDADLARLRLEGLEHLNRLQSGKATDYDRKDFLAWRAQGPAYEVAFRAAVRLQQVVRDRADLPAAVANGDAVVVPLRTAPRAIDRRMILTGALAASITGGVVLGRSLDLLPAPAELRADYRTGPGERRPLQLAGGARAELNTRTSVKLRSGLAYPAIELIAGEAVLTSGPGAGGQVAVFAGDGGSVGRAGQFNARRDGALVCITCVAGIVDVAWHDERRTLRAAQTMTYDDRQIGQITAADDLEALTAWRSGTLIFRNMPMGKVVEEINRYRPGKVFLTNDALARRPLTGTYQIARLDDFFSQASLGLGVRVTRLPAGVVILA